VDTNTDSKKIQRVTTNNPSYSDSSNVESTIIQSGVYSRRNRHHTIARERKKQKEFIKGNPGGLFGKAGKRNPLQGLPSVGKMLIESGTREDAERAYIRCMTRRRDDLAMVQLALWWKRGGNLVEECNRAFEGPSGGKTEEDEDG